MMAKLNANERFEIFAELYYKRYHQMAPGKDNPVPPSVDHLNRKDNSSRYTAYIRSELVVDDLLDAYMELKEAE